MVVLAEAQPETNGVEPGSVDPSPTFLERIRTADRRALVFVAASIILVTLALTGRFNASSDVTITREQAIEIAYDHVQFEPVNADARLIRQGFRLTPVWGVSLSIPSDGTAQDFERLNTVEIDAQTGEVLRVSVDDIDAVEDEDEE